MKRSELGFLESSSSFLRSHGFSVVLPKVVKYEERPDGKYHATDSTYLPLSSPAQPVPFQMVPAISFTALDSLIDIKYPHLEGRSFKRKYEALPCESRVEIILRETYRALKILRNAAIHNRGAFASDGARLVISYHHHGTTYVLEGTFKVVSILNSLCVLFIDNSQVSDAYFDLIVSSYYRGLLHEIGVLSDEFSSGLASASPSLPINPRSRFRITNPSVTRYPDRDAYTIRRHPFFTDDHFWPSEEYVVSGNDGTFSIVPGGALSPSGELSAADLAHWKVDLRNSIALAGVSAANHSLQM